MARPGVCLRQWSAVHDGSLATAVLDDGSTITATADHRFWVASDRAWLELDAVESGDYLLSPNGVTRVESLAVTSPAEAPRVWELDVAVDDNFAVSTGTTSVLVHNCGTRDASGNPVGSWTQSQRESIEAGSELGGLDPVPRNVLDDAIAAFTNRRITLPGGDQVLLSKEDLAFILQRHHPKYFDPSTARTLNTAFDGSLTPDGLADLAESVIRTGTRVPTPDGFTFTQTIDGIVYELFVNTRTGHIEHFTPKVPGG